MRTLNGTLNILLVAAIALPLTAQADLELTGQEGRGGRAVYCDGKPPVMLDYFHATLGTIGSPPPTLLDISRMSAKEVVDVFEERLTGFSAAKAYLDALTQNGPMTDWIAADLRDIDDSNEPYFLPRGCRFKQAAIRQDSVVYGDPTVINELSPAQQGMLLVHEALYRMAADQGFQTSEKVRNLVRAMLKVKMDKNEVQRLLVEMKQKVYMAELLGGAPYYYASNPRRFAMEFSRFDPNALTIQSNADLPWASGKMYCGAINSCRMEKEPHVCTVTVTSALANQITRTCVVGNHSIEDLLVR